MSILLSKLLLLSHELACGRKRQAEWEDAAERHCRRRCTVPVTQPTDENLEPATPKGLRGHAMYERDVAEMRLLRNALASQDTIPRAADTEDAFFRLLCAADKSAPTASIECSNFQWMLCMDVEKVGNLPVRDHDQIRCEVLCPKSEDKEKLEHGRSDDTFARLLNISGEEEAVVPSLCVPPSEGLNAAHNECNRNEDLSGDRMTYEDHAAVVRKHKLPEALERLSALLNTCAASKDYEDEVEDDEHSEEMSLIREMSQEAMLEAEQEELKTLLLETALDVSVSTHCTVEYRVDSQHPPL